MKALVSHLGYEFRTGFRNPSQAFMNYLFPIAVYLILGGVMTRLNPAFAPTMIPAMILLAGMSTFLLGFPGPLVEARQAGVYRSFKVNGVPAAAILFAPVATAIVHFLIVTAIITVSAGPLFGAAPPSDIAGFVAGILLTALCFGALGTVIGVVAENSRVVMMLSQIIFLPSMLLAGLMVPLSMIPDGIRSISLLLPTTYLMQFFSGVGYGLETQIAPVVALLALAASTAIAAVLAVVLYSWEPSTPKRRRSFAALAALLPFVVVALLSL